MDDKQRSLKHNVLLVWMTWSNEDKRKTFIIAVLLSLVCSLMVATSAVLLKPKQQANKKQEIQENILTVADIPFSKRSVSFEFSENIEVKLVDIQKGNFIDHPDPQSYDWRGAMNDPINSVKLVEANDVAKIKRRPNILPVYLVKDKNQLKRLILPVYGYGLWSTLYGLLALEADLQTVGGISFYEHAETPGLGGEVDNPKWRESWKGKKVYDESGNVKLEAIRGYVKAGHPMQDYQVDGLSGASLTTQGVSNLIQFWMGENGYGPFLKYVEGLQQ